ncbi:protein kinase domain-containing protein [Phocaeicola barnesiae]|uniref:protein kinase domain-containing protein n=1 Tax=Phocaeicola barnesiae TaxID=376804 RepID=UPI00241D9643|nr:SH3 domain-containing protein [Phocaeicola barnesiae]
MSETLRPNETERPSGTIRPDGTMRPNGTMRPSEDKDRRDGTLRPASDIKPFEDENQESTDTSSNDRTLRQSGTLRSAEPTKIKLSTSRMNGKSADVKKRTVQTSDIQEFTLDNVTYKVDKLISASTGEAEIYKLSKGKKTYVLKLYYAGYSPDPEVMETLKKASGTGFLVDLIDYGRWISPQGEQREYELQPFYSGGELTPGMMAGDADKLKVTAGGMIMALKVAHDHNILHKDIKPGNFFYRDESHTQLLLADFGIASAFKRDSKGRMIPLKAYAQWRTKIYAAPEIYTAIDGEIEYPDEKSDYYSLGMSLLTLWIGEKPFEGMDERTMIRLKRGEKGTLPYPDDLPEQLLRLIKGLTIPNPEKRWGFAEFERWAKGENVPIEDYTHTVAGELDILYNGSKNQRATSKEELAKLMMEDTKLAEKYLYSGNISKWFADAGYPEWQIQMDEIVNKLYPKSRYSGVMAACYTLDPSLPFIGIEGEQLETQEDIAIDIWNHEDDYLKQLTKKDAPLYIFLEANGIKARNTFLPLFKKQPFVAIWRMIFSLYPEAPFPFYDTVTETVVPVYNVDELIEAFKNSDMADYDNYAMSPDCSIYTPFLLYDECFITWLAAQDPALAGKIKSIIPPDAWEKPGFYYYIFYMLAPERNYDYETDQEKNFTVAQLAESFNQEYLEAHVLGNSSNEGFYDLDMRDGNENRLSYYLRSKGMYKDKFDYLEYCFKLDSTDNRRKAGPYNLDIAYFKAFKALAGSTFYYFPKSKKNVWTTDELKQIPIDEQREQLNEGKLMAWLAVQYQEDPFADLSPNYAYEILLAKFTAALAVINPQIEEAGRYAKASDKVEALTRKIRRKIGSIRILRIIWAILVILPLLSLAATYFIWGVAQTEEPVSSWKQIWIPIVALAIPLRFLQSFSLIERNVNSLFGEKLGEILSSHRWITSVLIAAIPLCLLTAMEHWGGTYGRWFMPVICLAIAVTQFYKTIIPNRFWPKQYTKEINPDVEVRIIEPLFYAWRDKGTNKAFESSLEDDQNYYSQGLSTVRRNTIRKIITGMIWTALMALLWFCTSPAGRPYLQKIIPDLELQQSKKPRTSSTTTYQVINVRSSLNVRKSPSTEAAVIGTLTNNAIIEVFEIKDDFARIKFGEGEGYVNTTYIKKVEKTE